MLWTLIPSPVGELLLTGDGEALTGVFFTPHKGSNDRLETARTQGERADDDAVLAATRSQLGEYFAGARQQFELPLAPQGTPFRMRVWQALREIPYGVTESYGGIAARLGLVPGASRAVGLANGANPISIVVPCHRVIGASGGLTGFGGGIERKRFLLDLESPALF